MQLYVKQKDLIVGVPEGKMDEEGILGVRHIRNLSLALENFPEETEEAYRWVLVVSRSVWALLTGTFQYYEYGRALKRTVSILTQEVRDADPLLKGELLLVGDILIKPYREFDGLDNGSIYLLSFNTQIDGLSVTELKNKAALTIKAFAPQKGTEAFEKSLSWGYDDFIEDGLPEMDTASMAYGMPLWSKTLAAEKNSLVNRLARAHRAFMGAGS